MNGEEAVKVFDLAVKGNSLPATMDKLVPLSFIGAAAVKFYQAKVKLMDQLGMSEAQRRATLADGQDAGEMLLNIEARIGELIEPMRLTPTGDRVSASAREKSSKLKATTLGQKQSENASKVFRNPAAVAAVIKEAKWSKWSDREIARRCAVSPGFVDTLRAASLPTEGSE